MAEFALRAVNDGLVVDVQSDLLDEFGTRVVVPLLELAHAPAASTPSSRSRGGR
jgi:hypothetical protein